MIFRLAFGELLESCSDSEDPAFPAGLQSAFSAAQQTRRLSREFRQELDSLRSTLRESSRLLGQRYNSRQ
jgi:hypothetical protein